MRTGGGHVDHAGAQPLLHEAGSVEALNTYLFHPLHQALIADLKPYFEWAAVDYTV